MPTKRASGPARRLVDLVAGDPNHVIALSPFILGEVGKVLSYPRLQALYGLSPDEIHAHVQFLESIARIVEPAKGLPVVLSDPFDDPVIYTAVSASSDVLCTRDRHFFDPNVLSFCEANDIRVMDEIRLLESLAMA